MTEYETLGQKFLEQYYNLFDAKSTRAQVCNLYHPQESTLTFEGQQFKGAEAIMGKYVGMPFDNLKRELTTFDIQPLYGVPGILIQVLGQLKTDSENDKVMGFSQTFVLRNENNSYYLFNDVFRLVLHNFASS